MRPPIVALFVSAVTAMSASLLMGCAAEEYESEAAYPPPAPVGYTPPSQAVPSQPTFIPPPPPAQPPQPVQAESADVPVDGEQAPAPSEAGYGPDDQYAETDPSALTDFRGALDPYGNWVDDPTYGQVWVPSSSVVGSDFTPYVSAGHWTYDDDYTWVSDYDWGWAPFHYGRWAYSSPYGWEWIPGRRYAGAWVSWRYGVGEWGYVGWAPLGPTWGWRGGAAFGLGYPGAAPYAFCNSRNLFAPHIGPVLAQGSAVGTIGAHTTPWTGTSTTGRIGANPTVNGPPPSTLGIPASTIAHGATTNRGIAQAQAYAHPSTAVALGAHAPAAMASHTASSGALGRSPAYGAPAPSHFGGKLGSGFRGSIANQRPSYSMSGARPYFGGAAGSRGPYGGGSSYGGAYHGGAVYGGPHAVPSGQPSSGHRGSSSEESSGGYHGGGSRGGGGRGGGGHGGGHR